MSNNQQSKSMDSIRVTPDPATTPPSEPISTEPENAAEATSSALTQSSTDVAVAPVTKSGSSQPKLRALFTRKHLLIAGAGLVVIVTVVLVSFDWLHLFRQKPAATTSKVAVIVPTPTPVPTPTTVPDPLTGQQVTTAAAQQPVVGVMIENFYPNARPQSGLSQAGIVYEALAEGGITRFEALFQETFPGTMGPVRSLRPYYLDWGLEHNIPVAHAGGSQPALAEIVPLGLKNINALQYDGSYFYRTTDRVAPHNLYTNSNLLAKLVSNLGFATPPTFTSLPRKADSPLASPTHTDIHITFSYTAYNAEYKYNAAGDDYLRFEGGAPQIDRNTNQQIQVKNVVVQFIPVTYGTQNDGDPDTDYHLIGTGKLLVFEDGNVITGTWSKTSDSAQTQLLDSTGKPIKFNVGNTWISSVPTGASVTF